MFCATDWHVMKLFGYVIYGIVWQSWVKDGHRNEIKEKLPPLIRLPGVGVI
jgi:hypothetical protein